MFQKERNHECAFFPFNGNVLLFKLNTFEALAETDKNTQYWVLILLKPLWQNRILQQNPSLKSPFWGFFFNYMFNENPFN